MRDFVGKKGGTPRRALLFKWAARVALLTLVTAAGAFGVLQGAGKLGAADCGKDGSFTVAPRTLRSAQARGAWATEAITPDGDGVYTVTKPEQLAWIAEQVNTQDAGGNDFDGETISLAADLDLGASEWTPIGMGYDTTFKGIFIGNNHVISNLKISTRIEGAELLGLFGILYGAEISGLHLRDVAINYTDGDAEYIGAIAGWDSSDSVIKDCTVQGSVRATNAAAVSVGGIVGQVSVFSLTTPSLTNSHVLDGSIVESTTQEATGGLIGAMLSSSPSTASVMGCSFFGEKVAGNRTVGGIIGVTGDATTVDGCAVNTNVIYTGGMSPAIGGIVGFGYGVLKITNCVSYGLVSGSSPAVGGILGYASSSVEIRNCTNEAMVTNDLSVFSSPAEGFTDTYSPYLVAGVGGIVGLIESPDGSTHDISLYSTANSGTVTMIGTPSGSDGETTATYYTAGAGGLVGTVADENSPGTGSISSAITGSMNIGDVSITGTASYTSRQYLYYNVAAGGIAGAYSANTRTDAGGQTDIISSYNTGNIDIALFTDDDNFASYAGGLVGINKQNETKSGAAANFLTVKNSYHRGTVNAGYTTSTVNGAGGIVGGALANDYSEAAILDSYSFMEGLTATSIGGLIGRASLIATYSSFEGDLSGSVFNEDSASLSVGNWSDSTSGNRASKANMENGSAFSAWGNPWVLDNSLPTLSYTSPPSGIAPKAGMFTIPAGSTAELLLEVFPHADIRSKTATVTYTVSGTDLATYFTAANGLSLTAGNKQGIAKLTITGIATDADPFYLDVLVEITAPSSGEGDVSDFYIRNLPLAPVENETLPVYLMWKADGDADDAEPRSADELPGGELTVSWDITPPAGGGNWDVSLAQDSGNPLRASLSVSDKTGTSSITRELYSVTVYMKQVGDDGETIFEDTQSRGFYVGAPFPTNVNLSPEAQKDIDEINSILCRTGVMIFPGNHQPPIPQHILDMIAVHLRDNLVVYESTDSGRGADGDLVDLYVLTSMDVIEDIRVETSDSLSLPECFTTTDKDSANIKLDLLELLKHDPSAEGKVVILPMTYSVEVKSAEMKEFYPGTLADSIISNPAGHLNEIFNELVLHKRIKEGNMLDWYTRLVDGIASPQEAYNLGMLLVNSNPEEGSLTIGLAYNVVNYHGESFLIQGSLYSDGSGGDIGYILLPDGLNNDTLIDPLWTNRWVSRGGGGGSGGGGCAAGAAIPLAMLALFGLAYRRRTR